MTRVETNASTLPMFPNVRKILYRKKQLDTNRIKSNLNFLEIRYKMLSNNSIIFQLQEYHDNIDGKSQQSSDSDDGIQCANEHQTNNSSNNGRYIVKGLSASDLNNVDKINAISNENVATLVET